MINNINNMTIEELKEYKEKVNEELNKKKNQLNDTEEFKILFKKVKKCFCELLCPEGHSFSGT